MSFIYDRVYLIGVDGAGAFFNNTDTPNIDRIFEGGASNHEVITSNPSISAQCWGSMLHGVTPRAHRLSNGTVGTVPLSPDFPYDSIFKLARKKYPDAALASVSNWNPINVSIIEDDIGVIRETGEDDEICDKVCRVIEENDPKLLFVQFDSVDGAGHKFGYGFRGHLDQISKVDSYIGRIYDTAEKCGVLENTLFLVTADHGGTPDGEHGGSTPEEMKVSFFARGRSVVPGTFGYMEIRDTASVVAFALGLTQPSNWSGRIPDGFFEDAVTFDRVSEAPSDGTKRYSDHINEPAPTGEGRRLSDFINPDGLTCWFPFDGDTKDALGRVSSEAEGKIYFTEGFYGSAVTLDDGVINCSAINTGTVDYTICMWLKLDKVIPGEKWTFFSTMEDDNDTGIRFSVFGEEIMLEVGLGNEIIRHSRPLPENWQGNIFHFLNKYNRTSNETCFYYDFAIDCDWYSPVKIPRDLKLDGKKVTIGGNVPVTIDDLIVFNHNARDAEIDSLCRYYEENGK